MCLDCFSVLGMTPLVCVPQEGFSKQYCISSIKIVLTLIGLLNNRFSSMTISYFSILLENQIRSFHIIFNDLLEQSFFTCATSFVKESIRTLNFMPECFLCIHHICWIGY